MNNLDVGAVLRKIDSSLAAQGKKKQEFYKATGISSASYSQWNKGVCVPSQLSLTKAAAFIGMTYEELVFEATKDDKRIKKEAPPAGGASGKDDLVRLSEDAQDRLYKIFSAALEANNITGGFAVSRAGVGRTILTRMQNKRLSMANRSELMQLARFLEVQAEAEPLIQGLPALEETLADIYRQLHDQIYQIDPDDIGTVSEVLQVWIKSRKRQ